MSSTTLRILVTDSQQLAGLGAIRSLGRAGHRVCAGAPQGVFSPGHLSRWCSKALVYPDPWHRQEEFREWVLRTLQGGDYDAILPVSEAAVVAIAALRSRLPAGIIAVVPADEHLRITLSKYQSNHLAQSSGLTIAKTVFVHDGTRGGSWNDDLSSLTFPIVLKTDNVFTADGAYRKGRTHIAHSPREAEDMLSECRALGCAVIAQEFIPGTGQGVSILRWNGTTHLTFTHGRLHEVPWSGGVSSLRESLHDPALEQSARTLLEAVGYQGIAMVEFRRQKPGTAAYFMEINGRLWGSIALAQHAGLDFPAALIDCYLSGRPAPDRARTDYRPGLQCRNTYPGEVHYVLSVLKSRTEPNLPTPPSKLKACLGFLLRTLNPLTRSDSFWWSDPLPALCQVPVAIRDVCGGVWRRVARLIRRTRDKMIVKGELARHRERASQNGSYFPKKLQRVLFVCHGNICRSPFAEYYWNERLPECPATSAGYHPIPGRPTPTRLQPLTRTFEVDLDRHRSQLVARAAVSDADAIFVMDAANWRNLTQAFPEARSKTFFLGAFCGDDDITIADPEGLEIPGARSSFEKLVRSLDALIATVRRQELSEEQSSSGRKPQLV